MDDNRLRKLQLTLLGMLKDIDAICKKHGINYWLDSGSLLGAVRHQGFIPWDDDLDIGMLRKDYEKFLSVAPREIGDNYLLQNWHSDEHFGYPFTKIIKRNTKYVTYLQRNVSAWEGIFIDIFPFDVYPGKAIQRFFHKYSVVIPKGIVKIKCGYDMDSHRTTTQKIRALPFRLIARFCSREWLIKQYEKNISKYDRVNTGCYFACNATDYGKYVLKEKWLGKLTPRKFEDGFFPCPDDCEAWLTMAYGDYMKFPPIEKRRIGHEILELSFDTTKDNII